MIWFWWKIACASAKTYLLIGCVHCGFQLSNLIISHAFLLFHHGFHYMEIEWTLYLRALMRPLIPTPKIYYPLYPFTGRRVAWSHILITLWIQIPFAIQSITKEQRPRSKRIWINRVKVLIAASTSMMKVCLWPTRGLKVLGCQTDPRH